MNNKLKQQVLENGCYSAYLGVRKYNYFCHSENVSFDLISEFNSFCDDLFEYSFEEIREAEKLYHNKKQRCQRLSKKIEYGFSVGQVYFGTLTFSDDTLAKNSSDSLRQMVRRFLSSLDCLYYCNQDFGGQFGRVHYHFIMVYPDIVCCDSRSPDYFLSEWNKRGFSNLSLIPDSSSDKTRVSKYVAKCTNHALKETALRSSLIYSRKKPSWLF